MRNALLLILGSVFLLSCATKNPQESRFLATLYSQKSAESHALLHQTYQMAKRQLAWKLRRYKGEKKPVVVLDVDETVLDNSPFQGKLYRDKSSFNVENWNDWVGKAQAKALPGAKDFLDFARKMGCEVYFITNRRQENFEPTFLNLKRENLILKRDHLIMRSKERSKESRRQKLAKGYHIIMLLGDNLGDFDEIFEHGSSAERNQAVEKMRNKFGIDFIILPNPMYGAWETAGDLNSY